MRGTMHRAIWCPGLLAVMSAFAAVGQSGQSRQAPPTASPQRTILDNRVIRNAPGDRNKAMEPQPEAASGRTIDSILGSPRDLFAFRGGFLGRLGGDVSPPDPADIRRESNSNLR